MIDPAVVQESPDIVKRNLERRHKLDLLPLVDELVVLQARRVAYITERDGLLNQRNVLSKEIGALMKAGQREQAEALKSQVTAGNARVPQIEAELAAVEARRDDLLLGLPNLLDDAVPDGASDADNVVVSSWGQPRELGFQAQGHVELGTRLGILDLERAAKLTGARFAVLRGAGARLERALISFFLDVATQEHGYTELVTPYIVHRRILEGTGQLPKFEADLFKLAGELNGADAFLIPTAEVPVTNLHRDEILDEAEVPLKYAAFTPCFRAEAGAAGRDVRGIIRQHQFHKVELVQICRPEDSERQHQELTGHAEKLLQLLGLPYRKSLLCAGDISGGARKCYDLEVWLPSQGAYREISSCSNFGDYQARRMMLRYRPDSADGKKGKPRFLHTINGSGLAVGRTLVAILENGQQEDGSVELPQVLAPYLGGQREIRPTSG